MKAGTADLLGGGPCLAASSGGMGGKYNCRRGAGSALFSAQPGATIVLAGEGGRNPFPLAFATASPEGRP